MKNWVFRIDLLIVFHYTSSKSRWKFDKNKPIFKHRILIPDRIQSLIHQPNI